MKCTEHSHTFLSAEEQRARVLNSGHYTLIEEIDLKKMKVISYHAVNFYKLDTLESHRKRQEIS